jgi:large repetitive protein
VITKTITAAVPAGVASGTYVITVTASGTNDNGGGALSMSSTYSVVVSCNADTTPPVLTLPSNQIEEATSASGAVGSFTASALDAVDGAVTPTCAPASGSTFPLGVTTVNCSAQDVAGNSSNGSFTVTVRDTTGPVVTPPSNVTAEATSSSGAVVSYGSASAVDAVDGAVTASCLPASGSQFALGNTTVTCSAADSRSNSGSATFTVSVGDTTPPAVTVPGNQTLEATGPSGAAYTYSPAPSATDAVAGSPAVTCSPFSGSTFGIATTTVTCSASDGTQTGSNSFTVTVRDLTGPALSGIPATVTLEATSPAGAALSAFSPSATDLVDGSRTVVCTNDDTDVVITAATVYALDQTTDVTCASSDTRGNQTTQSYSVTVQDTTAPVVPNLTNVGPLEATSAAGRAVSFTVTAVDVVDGNVSADCVPASGSTFALGVTEVTCTATDGHSNTSGSKSFTVEVVDTTPPAIAAHGNETAEATSAAGAVVAYTAPATSDIVDGAGVAICLPAPGSQFALGATTVSCTASDAATNAATPTSFTVTVRDTTAPVIASHGDVTAEATSAAGAVVSYTAPATSDVVDGAGVASCLPASGTQFALGSTTVNCTATDDASNVATPTSFAVIVADTTAPAIAAHGNVTAVATSAAGAVATYTSPATSDAVDGPGVATCLPASGSTFAPGSTTVTCNAVDVAGNHSTPTTFSVIVSFNWSGFYQPIDTRDGGKGKDSTVVDGVVFNKVKAGSTVPVKFSLGGDMGLEIFADSFPKAVKVNCNANALTDAIEETSAATTSGLKYDATSGQYNYAWKTGTGMANTCQRLEVKFDDGLSYYAFFQFTK